MIRHLTNPDAGNIATNAIFTVVSMILSGYAGWQLADGLGMGIQSASALLMSTFAFALGVNVVRRERYRCSMELAEANRDGPGYLRAKRAMRGATLLVVGLIIANIATDFQASSTIRDLSIVKASNANTQASVAQKRLETIKKRIATLTQSGDMKIKFLRPEAYEQRILAKEEEMRQESLRGCRKPPCKGPNYLADMNELGSLKANMATAKELASLYASLPAAEQAVRDNPEEADVAMGPIQKLASVATQNLEVDPETLKWSLNYFLLALTALVTAVIYFSSADLGRRLGPMRDAQPFDMPDPAPRKSKWYLESPDESRPIPLEAVDSPRPPRYPGSENEPSGNSTVIYSKTTQSHDKDAIRRLMAELEDEFGLQPKH